MGWVLAEAAEQRGDGVGRREMLFMVGAYLGWRNHDPDNLLGALSGSVIGVGHMLYKESAILQNGVAIRSLFGSGRPSSPCCLVHR